MVALDLVFMPRMGATSQIGGLPMAHGKIHWNELNSTDPGRAADFYEAVLGWKTEQVVDGETSGWLIRQNGAIVGGMFSLDGPGFEGIPSHWFTYVSVDDLDQALVSVENAGGAIARPAKSVPAGRMAVIQDPTGAYLALIEPLSNSEEE